MNIRVIISAILFLSSIFFSVWLYNIIQERKEEIVLINTTEDAIKERLKLIRDIQASYFASKGTYAKKWSEMVDYCENDKIYTVVKSDTIFKDWYYYGKDSIGVIVDTINSTFVKDSLLSAPELANFDIKTLGNIPGNKDNKEFDIWTGVIDDAHGYDIKDVDPINPERINGGLDTLRIGSKKVATTRGSWEK